MNVVIFDKEAENIEKSNIKINNLINRRIKVFGTVTEYNGSLEVILKDSKSLIIIAWIGNQIIFNYRNFLYSNEFIIIHWDNMYIRLLFINNKKRTVHGLKIKNHCR